MKKRFGFLVLGLVVCLVLTGCYRKPETPPSASYPQRIVALSPAAVENLFAVSAGAQVVAVSDFTDYPPEAVELPKIGGFDGKTLSIEKILSYKPDLVYLTDGMHNFLIEALETAGVKYYLSAADSIDAVKKEILEIGEITGHADRAKTVVAEIDRKLSSVKAGGEQKAYYEVWYSPYMSVGAQSFIDDVLTKAGYKNIFSDVNEPYPMVSEETIIAREPDVIFITASSGVTAEVVAVRAGWNSIPAVANGKVIVVDDNLTSRPSARIADAVLELVK